MESQTAIRANGSDLMVEKGDQLAGGYDEYNSSYSGEEQKQSFARRRACPNGCPMIPVIIGGTLFGILCLIAILIPVNYMAIAPVLAQKSVSNTKIALYNIRLTDWAYVNDNPNDTCAKYFPSTMTVTQDIKFSDIPWYGQLGPAYILPAVLDLSFNGTKFGELYMPTVDLSHPINDAVWFNNSVSTMKITNMSGFLNANSQLLPMGTLMQGWTIWNQNANVVLKTTIMGITSYYSADMNQNVNVSNPAFLSGPMMNIQDDIFDALMCINPVMNPGSGDMSL